MPDIDLELDTLTSRGLTPCAFVTGSAGTGKSHTIRTRLDEDPDYAILTGSTGIAAVNMNSITIHSLLGFFDLESLRDSWMHGPLTRKLKALRKSKTGNVVIDEVSMLSAEVLDLLVAAFDDVNAAEDSDLIDKPPLGLILVGDFLQLPPIKARFAFQAESWPRFAENTLKLTKNWRQGEGNFLDALGAMRAGQGEEAAELLAQCGVEFYDELDMDFDGTTIVAKNDKVDKFNQLRLMKLAGKPFGVRSQRWSHFKEPSEWKNIPELAAFKVGAYVMLLANSYFPGDDGKPELVYANGDCGHITDVSARAITVQLVRNSRKEAVGNIIRSIEWKHTPEGMKAENIPFLPASAESEYMDRVHYNPRRKRYVVAQIQRYPLRLAWASTCHKSQGLTLDRVQIDFRDSFFGQPGMAYVAVSRARTVEGLRIVGSRDTFVRRVNMATEVKEWL